MPNHFQSGTAVITGAGSGIGRATAELFARDGCVRLLLGDLSMKGLEETRGIIQKRYSEACVEISELDVRDEASVEAFCALAVEKFGRIDYAANVAGIAQKAAPSTEVTEAEFERVYDVNIKGVFLCERAQLRQMVKQEPLPGQECRGSIVDVGCISSTSAIPGSIAYSSSKGAILGLVRTDAIDYASHKIRVNCVGPGDILTPLLTNVVGAERLKQTASSVPLKRHGEAVDAANAIVWLSSPMAAFLTGVFLPVDGGIHLKTGPTSIYT